MAKNLVVVNNYKNWSRKLDLIIKETELREKQIEKERTEILEDFLGKFEKWEPAMEMQRDF